jgi:hypothetical protein
MILVTGARGTVGREVVGRRIAFEERSGEPDLQELSRHPSHVAAAWRYPHWRAVDTPPPVLPTAAEVTGAPARSFRGWVADHADAFR